MFWYVLLLFHILGYFDTWLKDEPSNDEPSLLKWWCASKNCKSMCSIYGTITLATKRPCVWGHTLFLRVSRSSWSFFPNMFHSSRGAGCPCKYQPNEEACMRHWHHWRRPVTYLPFFSFFGFDLSVWQGAKPRTPKRELYMSFYNTVFGSVTQSHSARPFWDFISRCHRIDKK